MDAKNNQVYDEVATETLYATGYALFVEDRFADAAAVFRLMLQLAPTDERSWLALGECHERAGQSRLALELYSAGTVAAEPAPRCLLARFRTLWDLDRTAEADEAYESALAAAESADDAPLLRSIQRERMVRP